MFVLYAGEPDPSAYAEHVELCRRVAGATFRHGTVFGSPTGDPKYRYYAEFEFPDRESFKDAARTEEFAATGRHARDLGVEFEVYFADVD
ncbi:MAG TPA: hypothetical protein VGL76_00275 [Gaiellaceae bacterium]